MLNYNVTLQDAMHKVIGVFVLCVLKVYRQACIQLNIFISNSEFKHMQDFVYPRRSWDAYILDVTYCINTHIFFVYKIVNTNVIIVYMLFLMGAILFRSKKNRSYLFVCGFKYVLMPIIIAYW